MFAASPDVMFYKENLWNIVANRLPGRYRYVLCLDADVLLTADNLKERVIDALQTTSVLQPFARAVWTDSLGRPYKEKVSTGYGSAHGERDIHIAKKFHPGFALALRRDFWTSYSGFYEREPLGGGNTMFIAAITGNSEELAQDIARTSTALATDYRQYAAGVKAWGHNSIGYIEGDAIHLWHGSTKKRRYLERTALLAGFDPANDMMRSDTSGVLGWSTHARAEKASLIKEIESYFSSRDEDEWFDSRLDDQ
jgi:hypothetical protein